MWSQIEGNEAQWKRSCGFNALDYYVFLQLVGFSRSISQLAKCEAKV